jgi:hypothetical protein
VEAEAEAIVQYFNEVLDICQNAGLKVVVTVCNMAANNVRALKLLGATKENPSLDFVVMKLQQYIILCIS